MLKEIKYLIFIVIIGLFLFFTSRYYFSEENIKKVNKSRLFLLTKEVNNFDLPVLSSDTNNIIIYSNEVENYTKKKRKYNFFELIKKKSDE